MFFRIRIMPLLSPSATHSMCWHLFVVRELRTSMTLIAMLTGVFILLVGSPKSDRLKGRGQTK